MGMSGNTPLRHLFLSIAKRIVANKRKPSKGREESQNWAELGRDSFFNEIFLKFIRKTIKKGLPKLGKRGYNMWDRENSIIKIVKEII